MVETALGWISKINNSDSWHLYIYIYTTHLVACCAGDVFINVMTFLIHCDKRFPTVSAHRSRRVMLRLSKQLVTVRVIMEKSTVIRSTRKDMFT